MSSNLNLALFGNPNCGKTSVFNLLTGLNQKVSNYPGITVEKKITQVSLNDETNITIEDYPGTYSFIPQSIDEGIVTENILQWVKNPKLRPDSIVYVADLTNLRQNLLFLTQLTSLNIPIILLLNMSDLVKPKTVDIELLKKELNIYEVILFSASKKTGLSDLKAAIANLSNDVRIKHNNMTFSKQYKDMISPLTKKLEKIYSTSGVIIEQIAFSLLCNRNLLKHLKLYQEDLHEVVSIKTTILDSIDESMKSYLQTLESDLRYGFIDDILSKSKYKSEENVKSVSLSEKIDTVITHKWLGPIIYIGLLYFIFQSIFTWASVPMDFIDSSISSIGEFVYSKMPDMLLRDLIVDGIIAGIGGIVIFLPQILFLMFFMIMLEDSGYMTRITFLMDKFMRKVGLHGKSILPIMRGYACAIPGIISTRTIDSWKERLITILILPLISCAARLPVYVLMIGAFIPNIYIYEFIGLQGLTMVVMYFLGTITALILAKVFSKFLSERSNPTFVMELPPYRLPIASSVLRQLYNRGKLFVVNAGKIVIVISIILWFLASFPKNDLGEVSIDNSYAGKIGHLIEPVIEPLGFDWKIGIGLITSFAAREVVVSTLSTIYNVDDDGDDMVNLKEAMRNDINPKTGKPVYTPLVALSIMIFYVYAAQCMVTFAVVKTETNTWKWPIFMIVYMSFLAYFMSFLVYQGGKLLGFG